MPFVTCPAPFSGLTIPSVCRRAQRQTTHTAPTLPHTSSVGELAYGIRAASAPLSGVTGSSTAILSGVAEPEPPNVTPEQDASFGTRLKRLREAAGLTQEELASRAGLTAKAIGALERGERRRPYPHTVRSLADALGLSEGERASLLAAVRRQGDAAPAAPAMVVGSTLPYHPTPGQGAQPGGDRRLYPPGDTAAHPHGARRGGQDAPRHPGSASFASRRALP
jgi:transcriptional regulator with XRE-family HTH domain